MFSGWPLTISAGTVDPNINRKVSHGKSPRLGICAVSMHHPVGVQVYTLGPKVYKIVPYIGGTNIDQPNNRYTPHYGNTKKVSLIVEPLKPES